MKNILGFITNFLSSTIFGLDLLGYYGFIGVNVINNDVNRIFISWFIFITTFINAVYFMNKHFKSI